MTIDEARLALVGAALQFAGARDDNHLLRVLCDAASTYAAARLRAASGATAAERQESKAVVAPFGRSKGKPLHACARADLEWLLGAVERSIADPEKARFLDSNQELLEALRLELSKR